MNNQHNNYHNSGDSNSSVQHSTPAYTAPLRALPTPAFNVSSTTVHDMDNPFEEPPAPMTNTNTMNQHGQERPALPQQQRLLPPQPGRPRSNSDQVSTFP